MDVAVVGSVALDTVETPWGKAEECLGGAATYFSFAASLYARVGMIGVIGEDFPPEHVALLRRRGVDVEGLEQVPGGRTFRWTGRYHRDVNQRDTLDTQLNVFETFRPQLPEAARKAPFLFLANIHPALQLDVLNQSEASFVGLDTMDLWIRTTSDLLRSVLERVHVLIINDAEARLLTGEESLIKAARAVCGLGPQTVIIKKGEHGCVLVQEDEIFLLPAYPLENVVDPTGAGDSFAGGFMGFLARKGVVDFPTLCHGAAYGTVTASFTCEAFGPARLVEIGIQDIERRYQQLRAMTQL